MRAKHQKRACSKPPENPLIPNDRIRLAEPSRCRRHIFGEPGPRSIMRNRIVSSEQNTLELTAHHLQNTENNT